MVRALLSFFIFFGLASVAVADNGLVNVKSTQITNNKQTE